MEIETIKKELFDMVYNWGKFNIKADHTSQAFIDKMEEFGAEYFENNY